MFLFPSSYALSFTLKAVPSSVVLYFVAQWPDALWLVCRLTDSRWAAAGPGESSLFTMWGWNTMTGPWNEVRPSLSSLLTRSPAADKPCFCPTPREMKDFTWNLSKLRCFQTLLQIQIHVRQGGDDGYVNTCLCRSNDGTTTDRRTSYWCCLSPLKKETLTIWRTWKTRCERQAPCDGRRHVSRCVSC